VAGENGSVLGTGNEEPWKPDRPVFLLSDARYLDLYPNGRHAEEAAEHIDYLLQEILKPNNPYTMDSRDFGELRESIAKLSTILDRSSILKKTTLLTRLKRIEETYH
jgi:hypothetical protein